jgi:uncharacterized repeat protein (TIGR01451 family)
VRDLRLPATLVLGVILGVAQPARAEILSSADVAVSLSENRSPEPVVAGGHAPYYGHSLKYTITVRNNGTASAQAVTLGDPLPLHTTFVSFSQTSGPPFTLDAPPPGSAGTVTAMSATLSAGASASFELTVAVDADTAEGTVLVNTASVNSQSFDPAPANNAATTTTRVTTYAGFYVDVSASPDPILRGRDLSYVLTVENNGPSDAQAVLLTDPIPSNTSFVSFAQTSGPAFVLTAPPVGSTAPAAVTATIGTLALGAMATFTLVVRTDPASADGAWVNNTVTVNSPTRCAYDPTITCGSLSRGYPPRHRSDSEGTRVSAFEADLAVSISDAPDPVQAGGELSYVCTVVNNGPDHAAGIWLSCMNPPRYSYILSFVQNSGPPFELNDPAAHGALGAGESATFTLVIKVESTTAPGTVLTNTAWTLSNASDPLPANDRATTETDVIAAPPTN